MLWGIKTKNSQIVNFDHDQFTKPVLEKQSVQTSSQSFEGKKNPKKMTIDDLVHRAVNYEPKSDKVDCGSLKKSHYIEVKRFRESVYYGEIKSGKMNGKGIMLYTNGRVYEGDWVDNTKQGKAYEKFANQSVYEGDYHKGKPFGYGKFVWENGEIYEGQWQDGLKNGSGIWRGSKGDSYIGEWKHGKADGYGVHTWVNGDRYEGQFKQCLKHGEGVEKFANGDAFKGQYVNGKPQGYGEYFWSDGSFFKGDFKDKLRSGKGVWKKRQGKSDTYQGQYLDDKKHGYGIFTWQNGSVYKGNYKNDVRQGYGEMFWLDGSIFKGEWSMGQQSGENQHCPSEQLSPANVTDGHSPSKRSTQEKFNPQEFFEFHSFEEPNHPEMKENKKFRAREIAASRMIKSKNESRTNDIYYHKNNFVTEALFHNKPHTSMKLNKKNSGLSFRADSTHCGKRKIAHSQSISEKKAMSSSFYVYKLDKKPQAMSNTNIPKYARQQTSHEPCQIHGTRNVIASRQRMTKSSNGVRNARQNRQREVDEMWGQNSKPNYFAEEEDVKWFTRSKNRSQYF